MRARRRMPPNVPLNQTPTPTRRNQPNPGRNRTSRPTVRPQNLRHPTPKLQNRRSLPTSHHRNQPGSNPTTPGPPTPKTAPHPLAPQPLPSTPRPPRLSRHHPPPSYPRSPRVSRPTRHTRILTPTAPTPCSMPRARRGAQTSDPAIADNVPLTSPIAARATPTPTNLPLSYPTPPRTSRPAQHAHIPTPTAPTPKSMPRARRGAQTSATALADNVPLTSPIAARATPTPTNLPLPYPTPLRTSRPAQHTRILTPTAPTPCSMPRAPTRGPDLSHRPRRQRPPHLTDRRKSHPHTLQPPSVIPDPAENIPPRSAHPHPHPNRPTP